MLPLELGGVVHPELRVYGTSNLRIVDTSVFPMVAAGHLMATMYAVAEKAADLIKAVDALTKPPAPVDPGAANCSAGPSSPSTSSVEEQPRASAQAVSATTEESKGSATPSLPSGFVLPSSSAAAKPTSDAVPLLSTSLAFPAPAYSVPSSLTEGAARFVVTRMR